MSERYGPSHPEYVSIVDAILGHLLTDVISAPLLVGILWLTTWLMGIEIGLSAIFLIAILARMLSSVLVVLAERPAVVAARHAAPGGWGFAIWSLVIPPPVAAGVAWFESPGVILPSALAMLVFCVAEVLWLKPWRRSDGRAEVREKWEATKEMTQRMVNEEKLKDGWVIPKDKME